MDCQCFLLYFRSFYCLVLYCKTKLHMATTVLTASLQYYRFPFTVSHIWWYSSVPFSSMISYRILKKGQYTPHPSMLLGGKAKARKCLLHTNVMRSILCAFFLKSTQNNNKAIQCCSTIQFQTAFRCPTNKNRCDEKYDGLTACCDWLCVPETAIC